MMFQKNTLSLTVLLAGGVAGCTLTARFTETPQCDEGETFVDQWDCVPDETLCPDTLPAHGAPCFAEGRECRMPVLGDCVPIYFAYCADGAWETGHHDVFCPPEPGPEPCDEGQTYLHGEGCVPDETLCPTEPPAGGSSCPAEGLHCLLSVLTDCESSVAAVCMDGAWQIHHGHRPCELPPGSNGGAGNAGR